MKKKNILNLIKYHVEKNEEEFKNESLEIAKYFEKTNDTIVSNHIIDLISEVDTLTPQNFEIENSFFHEVKPRDKLLPLPMEIVSDIKGLINAINHNVGINKFIFEGKPGTGKTESVKHVARLLNRKLYMVDLSELVDSKLGQTSKNLVSVFSQLNAIASVYNIVVIFDELDSIALDRVNNSDIREMGRVTSVLLRELDNLNENMVLIATTNLYSEFDKALTRRFDKTINFNRYSNSELIDISVIILDSYLKVFKKAKRSIVLYKKIISKMNPIPFPGELENIIKTSLAFSNPESEYEYLYILLKNVYIETDKELRIRLRKEGFTFREIEILTGISKSSLARELKEYSE